MEGYSLYNGKSVLPRQLPKDVPGPLWEIAFPPVPEDIELSSGMSFLQFRLYGEDYNEGEIKLGQRVKLFDSEDEFPDEERISGMISGVRVIDFDDMPEANQKGVFAHFGDKALENAGGRLFMFWVTAIILASYIEKDPMDVCDITDW